MDSGIPFRKIKALRGEADLYGYSEWLAEYLNLRNKHPRCNFQHMWIWWDLEPEDVCWALDPNVLTGSGSLTQNEHIAEIIESMGQMAAPGGLPFLNFIQHHPIETQRNGKTLYVSTHSTHWRDVSQHSKNAIKEFTKDNDVTVLLSYKDSHLAEELDVPCLLGADTMDANSFYRIQKIFSEFDYMITDRMGSHVLYGMACGMKVGLSAKHNIDTVFSETAIARGLHDRAHSIRKTQFLADRFPGLVIEGGLPSYNVMPDIPQYPAELISKYIWS